MGCGIAVAFLYWGQAVNWGGLRQVLRRLNSPLRHSLRHSHILFHSILASALLDTQVSVNIHKGE